MSFPSLQIAFPSKIIHLIIVSTQSALIRLVAVKTARDGTPASMATRLIEHKISKLTLTSVVDQFEMLVLVADKTVAIVAAGQTAIHT